MFYSLIDFLRKNGGLILTILLVALIAVFVIITIFKKEDKKEVQLSLSKEKNTKNINVKTYAIYRKNIQDYIVYLFDENGSVILSSNLTNSILNSKGLITRIKENLTQENFIISQTLDGLYYGILRVSGETIARTLFYVTKNDIEQTISRIIEINESSILDDSTYKNDTIYGFESNIIKKKKFNIFKTVPKSFKIINDGGLYYSILNIKNENIFMSEPDLNTKIAKENCLKLYDSFMNKNIKIDENPNGKFNYYLLDKNNRIIYRSVEFNSKIEIEEKVSYIIENI